mmetsp:Transcript_49991/g.88013  ORF Transcript_49991/g.88013 Transcript_49991/m.88013 type:complete len:207 (-) Transcript_49991:914-1534(-)
MDRYRILFRHRGMHHSCVKPLVCSFFRSNDNFSQFAETERKSFLSSEVSSRRAFTLACSSSRKAFTSELSCTCTSLELIACRRSARKRSVRASAPRTRTSSAAAAARASSVHSFVPLVTRASMTASRAPATLLSRFAAASCARSRASSIISRKPPSKRLHVSAVSRACASSLASQCPRKVRSSSQMLVELSPFFLSAASKATRKPW